MARGGREKKRGGAERRCVVTGESRDARGLIRFVIAPDGGVTPDILGKLPGRGIWVGAEAAHLGAVAEKHFARAARQPVRMPDGLAAQVAELLAKRVIELISLARKAGLAVAGYEKVKGWLATDEAAVLFQAHDGSARGKSKLRPPAGEARFFEVLSASELGLAFGREHVIHAALAAGGLTDRVRDDALRLSGVRGTASGKTGGERATGKVK
ncbi:MAG: RNA-binding protein [Pseudomonadota bacterium]